MWETRHDNMMLCPFPSKGDSLSPSAVDALGGRIGRGERKEFGLF